MRNDICFLIGLKQVKMASLERLETRNFLCLTTGLGICLNNRRLETTHKLTEYGKF